MTDERSKSLSAASRLFSVPAGVEFIPALVDALLGQILIPGYPDIADPLALSGAKIFVPTRRAAQALASEIARRQGARSAILPQILPLGALADSEEAGLFAPLASAGLSASDMPEAMPKLERRLALTELILQWGRGIRNAILSVDERGTILQDESEPFVVTGAPGQAFHMAGELGALIDEMIIEDIDWRALQTLTPDNLDRYWSITLEFLKIAMEAWPKHLAETDRVDEAQRNVLLAEAEAERLIKTPPSTPYIVAGSTGTNAATAKLMAAIARLPAGAIVLPGADFSMDDSSWQMVSDIGDSAVSASHPQAAIAKLLRRFGVTREAVTQLAPAEMPVAARMEFLTQAMLPPDATSGWTAYRDTQSDDAISDVLGDITYIDAENERQEALAIAVAMRQVLETPDHTAAVITPDRNLARRIKSELLRWNIVVDDSGGDTLKGQPAGILGDLALQLAQGAFALSDGLGRTAMDPVGIIALFNHGDVRLGYRKDVFDQLAKQFEAGLLRGPGISLHDISRAIAQARDLAGDHYAHRLKQQIGDQDWIDIAECLRRLVDALAPLTAIAGSRGLHVWFSALRETLDRLRGGEAGEETPARADLEALDDLVAEFLATPETDLELNISEFAAFFDTVTFEAQVRAPQNAHPRLKILGLLEARLLSADVKILAGLDEAVWPPATQADVFLNRPMREDLGLSPPERRIGQTAHDFVEAMGAGKAILTRARKRDGAPAIPSRLIQRIRALAGDAAWDACRERGDVYIELAVGLDHAAEVQPVSRPAPRPPVDMRPKRLSVTGIETWRRDPYAIYARYILQLQPLDPAGVAKTPIDIGNGLHKAIEVYQSGTNNSETLPQAQIRMATIAQSVFAELLHDIHIKTFRWPRVLAALDSFVVWDFERRTSLASVQIELSGQMDITLDDGSVFQLTARADRIEQTAGSSAVLVDYKSSRPRSNSEIEVGFAPQLPLEAVMIEQGGFKPFARGTNVEGALYLTLLGPDGVKESNLGEGRYATKSLDELKSEHLHGLIALANQFRLPDSAYIPRPYPQYINQYGEYDHLARVKEWSDGSGGGEA